MISRKPVLPKFFRTALLVLSTTALISCSDKSENTDVQKDAPYFQVANIGEIAHSSSYPLERSYIGKISSKQSSVLTFEYGGTIQKTYVDSGDEVVAGDVLAELNTELLTIKSKELLAQINQTIAEIKLNSANSARFKSLADNGYASAQRIDELQAESTMLNAKKKGLEASLDSINYQLSRSKLIAPYDGIVDKRFVNNGELTSPNTPAFRINNKENVQINVGIPSKIANKLSIDNAYKAIVGEETVNVTLLSINKQIDASLRTVNLRFSVDSEVPYFNGQLAKVIIQYDTSENGFWVPLSALTDGVRGQWNIYLTEKTDNNELHLIKRSTVKVLHANQEKAYISGLESGTHSIILEGVHRYVPGQKVRKSNQNLALSTSEEGQKL